ncbi:MAG: hypothetical protein MHM6MM_001099 [Cercozoa sp. M6MM]
MKLLCIGATALSFVPTAQADQLVPLSIMRPTCIRFGKCIDDHGHVDPSVCCSGVCDKDNGCVSTTEASSVLLRTTLAGAPFICKKHAFFGVRACTPVVFNSGKIEADCLCPEGKPCLIGNGDTPLCSTRFWLGHCNPEGSECVPQLQISVPEAKTLFPYAAPTPDNGLGGPCMLAPDDTCALFDPDLACQADGTCLAHVASALPELHGKHRLGVEVTTSFALGTGNRDLNPQGFATVDGACSYPAATLQPVGRKCLCDDDCAGGLLCFMVRTGAQVTMVPQVPDQSLLDDLSVVGTCLVPPIGFTNAAGLPTSTCDRHCDCLPGHECLEETPGGSKVCKQPNGIGPCAPAGLEHCISGNCGNNANGVVTCIAGLGDRCVADVQCPLNHVCHIPPGWNKGHCLLVNFQVCTMNADCASGACVDNGLAGAANALVCGALQGEACDQAVGQVCADGQVCPASNVCPP